MFCRNVVVNERWALVKRHQLCFGCLTSGHSLSTCHRRTVCGVNGCQRKHHQLLHSQTEASRPTSSENQVQHVFNCRQESQSTLFKILPVTLFGPRGKIEIYAMIDEGSSVSLLSDSIATSLGLQGPASLLSLQWYGRNKTTEKSRKVTVELRGPDATHTFAIKNVRTIRNLNLPTQSFDKSKYNHLKTVPFSNYTDVRPDLLLGLDNSFLGIARDVVDNGPEQPIAAKTKLGWMVYGPLQGITTSVSRVMLVRESTALTQLHQLVENFIAVDSLAIRCPVNAALESDVDRRAREILEQTTKHIGGRYEVGLLWREDDVKLPPSYDMAQKRLLGIESRMKRDSQFAKSYIREIDKYVSKGYAREWGQLRGTCPILG
ncbi:uncharacterized protein LOC118741318 [Rhagoletis pomonella]|uniref:uncharacterized protein LOC118741318 n=1 Tax=Rhagoletis pomonella TaxID=28610 RepID=UPI0017863EFA|nr:uncharacterized protein LOC118741318 [Rhagoletis pomonella]